MAVDMQTALVADNWASIDGETSMSLSDRIASARIQRNLDTFALEVAEFERRKRCQSVPAKASSSLHWIPEETELELMSRELTLSAHELATVVGISDVMLVRLQRGLVQPSASTAEQLDRVRRFHARVLSILEPYRVPEWMRTPNPGLAFETPAEVLIAGELHRLEAALDFLES
jgi:transcriptional regulator with XRE-family HTH domain